MNKIFNNKKVYNVFELWKKVQIRLSEIQANALEIKKNEATELLEKYELIYSKIKPISNEEFMFENNIFVALIKYVMESNDFFDNRLVDDEIDELLLLAYIYEWLCLEKSKDVTLLGDKSEVLKKLRIISSKSDSTNKKIFENLDIDDISNWMELKRRVKAAAVTCFNEMILYLYNDKKIYKRILNERINIKNFDDRQEALNLWNSIFVLKYQNLNYVYSINDSDDKIIYISVETEDKKVAFVKFKMFYTYSLSNKELKATGVSKELIRIEFIDEKSSSLYGQIISNALIVANRVVKNIFLLNLQIKNDEQQQNKLNNFKNKKVVKIFKMHAKSEEKDLETKSKLIQKSLG